MAPLKILANSACPARPLPQAPPKPPDMSEADDLIEDWEPFEVPAMLPYDTLSKITEGSNEASEITSAFFSAISGATSRCATKSSKCAASLGSGLPSGVRSYLQPTTGMTGSVSCALPTPTRAVPRPSKLHAIQE